MTLAYVQNDETLTIPCPAAGVTLGNWIAVGNILGQALKTTTSGLDLEVFCPKVGTVVRIPKATGFIPAAGDVAFVDFGSDQRLESFAIGTGIRAVGFYAAAALTGDTAALVIWDPARAENSIIRERCSIWLDATKAVAKTAAFIAPFDGKIVALHYYGDVKPASSAGTVVLVAQNAAVSDHTLLSTANIDLEAMTEDAVTAMTLTSTAADLVLLAGQVAEFVATADNTDLVAGSGVHVLVSFQRT